jgi:hypothetical protein
MLLKPTLLLLVALAGCSTTRVVPEPVKPVVDARALTLCDTRLTPIVGADTGEFLTSYTEALAQLRACSCVQRLARNALCAITDPGCDQVPVCK